MVVAVALFEIHIPHAQSLKEKRAVVKSLREKVRHRFEISVAEVALHDVHQRARIGLSVVTTDHAGADAILAHVQSYVETNAEAMMTGWTSETLDFDEMATL